ncbi:hypothetical protein OROMI_001878 [Orobanche minor]
MKKQLKEEKKRRNEKMQAAAGDLVPKYQENMEEESSGELSVPVSMPDLALPASRRYRCLDSSNQWLVRPLSKDNKDAHLQMEISSGVKVEDKLIANKRSQLIFSAGAVAGLSGDVDYGGSLEATIRDKDHPLDHFLSALGLSVMDWHGDFAPGCNLQSQIPIGRSSNLFGWASVNNRGTGALSIWFNSTEHFQIVLLAAVRLVQKLVSHFQSVEFSG